MLVPSARHEGRVAAENAVMGTRRRISHEIVPTGSFTDPEYGSVGLTEEEARARYDCEVAMVRYDDLLRPVVDGHPGGFCKLIVESQPALHPRRARARRVLGRADPDGRGLHGGEHAGRAARRAAVRLPHLHRGGRHGGAEVRAAAGHRRLAQQWSDLRPLESATAPVGGAAPERPRQQP